MTERPLKTKEKEFISAIYRGVHNRKGLYEELNLNKSSFQKIWEPLQKLNYVMRPPNTRDFYDLTAKCSRYVETTLAFNPETTFGSDKFKKYLKLFPELFQEIILSTIRSVTTKQTKIFNMYNSGYVGLVLAGDPKTGKTPLAEVICNILGEDFTESQLTTPGVPAGEIKGRSSSSGRYDVSRWAGRVISVLEEPDKIKDSKTREAINLFIHSDKYYIRGKEKLPYKTTPFITMNVRGKPEEVVEEILRFLRTEYVKRNYVVNTNKVKPYLDALGGAYIFFGDVCKNYPHINFRPPILKGREDITREEKLLIRDIMKKAVKPGAGAFYDERGIEMAALADYSLAKENFVSSIYCVCKSRLVFLESLEMTV